MRNKSLALYENSITSRYLEQKIQEIIKRGASRRSLYADFGAEVGQGVVPLLLEQDDFYVPRYRGFAGLLAKGMPVEAIIATFLNKEDDAMRRIVDPMPYRYPANNIISSTLNLGAMFPIAAGLALTLRAKKESRIVVHAFGDGEASRSTFAAALNIASLWELPMLFVCENNRVSISTPFEEMSAAKTIAHIANGYGIAAENIPDSQPTRLLQRAKEIIEEIRKARRPYLLEIIQERFTPQSSKYATEQEHRMPLIPADKDPIAILEKELLTAGEDHSSIEKLRSRAHAVVDSAVSRAVSAPTPQISDQDFLSFYHE